MSEFIYRHSEKTKKKISKKLFLKNGATYNTIHRYFQKHYKKIGICSQCGKKPESIYGSRKKAMTEWANVTGIYTRNIEDYREMCRPCHNKFDKISLNLGKYTIKGSNNPTYVDRKKYNCDMCGKSFLKLASTKRGKYVFCTRSCSSKYHYNHLDKNVKRNLLEYLKLGPRSKLAKTLAL